MIAVKTPGPWHVLEDTYRRKRVYVVARLAGPRGRAEYMLSERTGRKLRYFDLTIARRHADEANAQRKDTHD